MKMGFEMNLQLFGGRGGGSGMSAGGGSVGDLQAALDDIDYGLVKTYGRYGDERMIKQPDSFEKLLALDKRSLALGLHYDVRQERSRLMQQYKELYDFYNKSMLSKYK